MNIELSAEDGTDLVAATSAVQRVRQWRRYQAILLVAEGQTPQAVAQARGPGGRAWTTGPHSGDGRG